MSHKTFVLRAALVTVFAVGGALPALAQNAAPIAVSAGYNWLHLGERQLPEGERTMPAGWYADVSARLRTMIDVVGQVTGNYKSFDDGGAVFEVKAHTFMGGVRVHPPHTTVIVPFGEVMFGVSHLAGSATFEGSRFEVSENDAALQFGGGLASSTKKIGLRVAVDYLRVFSQVERANVVRFAAGVVFGLGD